MPKNKAKFDLQELLLKMVEKDRIIKEEDLINNVSDFIIENSTEKRQVKPSYVVSRTLKKLNSDGYINIYPGTKDNFARITKSGKSKLDTIKLKEGKNIIPTKWDGFWRIVILDLPENRKKERESIRYILKKAYFVCLKNSVWISPFPMEHFLVNLKEDMELTDEMIISVSHYLDSNTAKMVLQELGLDSN